MTRIWKVIFDEGFSDYTVSAPNVARAVKEALILFKQDNEDYVRQCIKENKSRSEYSTWGQYVRQGHTEVTKVELEAKSDN